MVINDREWSLIKLTRQVNRLVPSQSLFQPMVDHPSWDSSIHTHKIVVKEYDFEMFDGTWLQTGHTALPGESSRELVSLSASLSIVLSQLKTRSHLKVNFGVKSAKNRLLKQAQRVLGWTDSSNISFFKWQNDILKSYHPHYSNTRFNYSTLADLWIICFRKINLKESERQLKELNQVILDRSRDRDQ